MTLDVLGQLEVGHRRLLRTLEQLARARQDKRRRNLLLAFQRQLRDHFGAEERLVFPAAQESVLTRSESELFAVARKEHKDHLQLLGGAAGRDGANRVAALVYGLTTDLRRHFQYEEERLFPLARRVLGRPMLLELAAALPHEEDDVARTPPIGRSVRTSRRRSATA